MTLPATGQVSVSAVVAELGIAGSAMNFGSAGFRDLANVVSGQISLSSVRGKGRYSFDANAYSTNTGIRSGNMLVAQATTGFFLFGPYVTLPAGSYTFAMYGNLSNPAGTIGSVDVVSNYGNTTYLNAAVSVGMFAAGVIFNGSFNLAASTANMEIRLYLSNTTTTGSFTGTVIRKIS